MTTMHKTPRSRNEIREITNKCSLQLSPSKLTNATEMKSKHIIWCLFSVSALKLHDCKNLGNNAEEATKIASLSNVKDYGTDSNGNHGHTTLR